MTWNDKYTMCLMYLVAIVACIWSIRKNIIEIRNPKREIDMQIDMGKPSRTKPKWFPWFYLSAEVLSLILIAWLFAGMLILHFFHYNILK